jgi:hypothetical protein
MPLDSITLNKEILLLKVDNAYVTTPHGNQLTLISQN